MVRYRTETKTEVRASGETQRASHSEAAAEVTHPGGAPGC